MAFWVSLLVAGVLAFFLAGVMSAFLKKKEGQASPLPAPLVERDQTAQGRTGFG